MSKKKQDSSWKNYDSYRKGKERLKNGIMQHPDEEPGDKSVFNFIKGKINKRKELHILPFKQFEDLGKINKK